MKLPLLFRQVHGDQIFKIWSRNDQTPIVRIVPQEPLGRVTTVSGAAMPDSSVTIVTVRCWNDRGTMQYEAASPADLAVAQEWARRAAPSA